MIVIEIEIAAEEITVIVTGIVIATGTAIGIVSDVTAENQDGDQIIPILKKEIGYLTGTLSNMALKTLHEKGGPKVFKIIKMTLCQ